MDSVFLMKMKTESLIHGSVSLVFITTTYVTVTVGQEIQIALLDLLGATLVLQALVQEELLSKTRIMIVYQIVGLVRHPVTI